MASAFLIPYTTTTSSGSYRFYSVHRPQTSNGYLRRHRVVSALASSGSDDNGRENNRTGVQSPSRREALSIAAGMCIVAFSPTLPSVAVILEADDDLELLERVKKDKKKRIERQELIRSSAEETVYLQEAVYKLDKVGQAIDSNDFSTASSVLGPDINANWIKNVNAAFTKLSSSPGDKTEIDAFNSSLVSLISSVGNKDVESSKLAFVSSASALEKWVTATGLIDQLKGI